jgi:hypothetical protein
MYVITATFDPELAQARIREMLALGDTPEALAERLGIARDAAMVKQGVVTGSFKRLLTEVKKHRQFLDIGQQIAEARKGTTMGRFLGSGFQEKKVAKLEEERKKFGSPLDYALDGALNQDARWTETEPSKLPFPIAAMFDAADLDFAKALADELEKPLKQISAEFLLQKFEGHRSIGFDVATATATYYMPAPAEV